MISATQYMKAAQASGLSLAVGLLLGPSLYLYQLKEILICWLFFILMFVLLALVMLPGIFVLGAGAYFIRGVSTTPRVISTACVSHSTSESHSGMFTAENRSEFRVTSMD